MDKTPEELAAEQAAADQAASEKAAAEKASAKKVKARVLVDCAHGKWNDVVLVTAAELAADNARDKNGELVGPGALDGSKAAVAYAESVAR